MTDETPTPGTITDGEAAILDTLAVMDAKLNAMAGPIAEFGEMLAGFKASPMGKMMAGKAAAKMANGKGTPEPVTGFGDPR